MKKVKKKDNVLKFQKNSQAVSIMNMASRIEELKTEKQKVCEMAAKTILKALDAKDHYTYGHSMRVTYFSLVVGKQLELTDTEMYDLQLSALFHDIGKIEAANIKREIKYNSYGDKYHEKIGAFIVDKFLKKVVKDIDLRKRISKIIEELNEKEPKFLETRLIKDADRLDNYGVIKIWRTVTYAQYQNRQIDRIYEYWEEEGRKKAKEELSPFYFKPIKSLAIKRFKKLDELIKEIKIENLGRDIKKNQRF